MKTPIKTILIHGGWNGHQPTESARLFSDTLSQQGCEVTAYDRLDVLDDLESLQSADLIIPMWTMGTPTSEQISNLVKAVKAGTGLGGFHGGMGDAFRGQIDYEWMVGGHFVGHPHVGPYTVDVQQPQNPIVSMLPQSFEYNSEQYYMLIDPVIEVLADTAYTFEGKTCRMPVIWTKSCGQGRVFYSALGHQMHEFESYTKVFEMTIKGILWAARS